MAETECHQAFLNSSENAILMFTITPFYRNLLVKTKIIQLIECMDIKDSIIPVAFIFLKLLETTNMRCLSATDSSQ